MCRLEIVLLGMILLLLTACHKEHVIVEKNSDTPVSIAVENAMPPGQFYNQFDFPDKNSKWLQQRQNTPQGTSQAQLKSKYQADIKAQRKLTSDQSLPAFKFEELGSGVFGGRTRSMVIHPEKTGHLLLGGVSGGVWKSVNDGQSWHYSSAGLSNPNIGSLAIDTNNPEVVYAGTGEYFIGDDQTAVGSGIFVSEDFGDSWQQIESTNNDDFNFVNDIVMLPNSSALMAATGTGLFRSVDSGATWQEVANLNISQTGFTDIKIDPTDSSHLLAAHFAGRNKQTVTLKVDVSDQPSDEYNLISAINSGELFHASDIAAEIIWVNDVGADTHNACDQISNDLTGKIALIEYGTCEIELKLFNARNAGAVTLVIYQDSPAPPFSMTISDSNNQVPVGMVSRTDGLSLAEVISSTPAVIKSAVETVNFIMRSTDSGATWQVLDDHGLPVIKASRMEIAFGTDGVTYVAVARSPDSFADLIEGGRTVGLFRSQGGNNATFMKTQSEVDYVVRQGGYNLAVAVNPTDSDHVIMGGVDQFMTYDAGVTIQDSSIGRVPVPFISEDRIEEYIHSDHHGYIFSPHDSQQVYALTDGGLYKSEDEGVTYKSLNNGINISQQYGLSVSPDGERVIAGTQDNGTQLYFGDQQNWLKVGVGDGGISEWDAGDERFVYWTHINGLQLRGSRDGGISNEAVALPSVERPFSPAIEVDAIDGNRMLMGISRVYLSTDIRNLGSASWQDISGELTEFGDPVSEVSFNRHDPSLAYAAAYPDFDGAAKVVKISELGTANTVTDITPDTVSADYRSVVTDIRVDAHDFSGNTIYLTYGGYFEGRILKSVDGGLSWQRISNNLPDMPVYQLVNDPLDEGLLYAATEVGLWVGTQDGKSYEWNQFDYGPANARILDLVWKNNYLFIATYGRGTFKATKQPVQVIIKKFIATNSSCDDDQFLDYGESGKLLIEVINSSAKSFSQLSLTFSNSELIDYVNSRQTIELEGFSSKTIELPVSLAEQDSCLALKSIPVEINTGEYAYNSSIQLLTAANNDNPFHAKELFSDGAETYDSPMMSVMTLGAEQWTRAYNRAYSGSQSWFSSNEESFSDKSLVSPWFTFTGPENQVSFALLYELEKNEQYLNDGLLLEMRLEGEEDWFDIGYLSDHPYDGQLGIENTAPFKHAWSGTIDDWIKVTVDLGSEFIGQTAQIRFRMVADGAGAYHGAWLDDLSVTNVHTTYKKACDSCVSQGQNKIPNRGMWYDPAHDGHGFIIEPYGVRDLYYSMFYTFDELGRPEWFNSLTTLANGVLNKDFKTNTLKRMKYDHEADPSNQNPIYQDEYLYEGRLSINFNSAEVSQHPACQDGVPRPLNQVALARWQLNEVTQAWCIVPIVSDADRPSTDFSAAWWAGEDDSGWGISVAQTIDLTLAYVFYYDAAGNPRWAYGKTDTFAPKENNTLPLYEVTGYSRTDPQAAVELVENGFIVLNLSNTLRSLETDGVTQVDLTFQGVQGGSWLRDHTKIKTLTLER